MTLREKELAPAFTAHDENGVEHTLAQYKGKWVILYFYPKDDTPGCTEEACNFRDNLDELQKHAVILGVSADSVESHKAFKEKYHLNFPLLADPDRKMINMYGTDGLIFTKRTTFLIHPEGKIEKIYQKVDPKSHVTEILKDLGEAVL